MLTKISPRIEPLIANRVNPTHPLARGLAACWLLNEGSGRIVHDVSGHHHDGNFSGNPVWSDSPAGRTIEFGGNDDWISMGDCLDLGTDDITVLAVVKYNVVSQPDEWGGNRIGAIVGKGHLDGTGKGYGLAISSGSHIHWQVRNQASSFSAISDIALNDDQWHLAIGVCDRDNSTGVRLYVDGVLQNIIANATTLNGIALNGSRAFAIGSRQDEATGAWFWDFAGSVAMVCVWKRVLAGVEILSLQQNTFAMFGSPRVIAMFAPPASVIVQCMGSIEAVALASAAVRVARGATGLISVSGSVSGALCTTAGQEVFTAMLRMGLSWLREALFNGATHLASKLGTSLTHGWFWMRRAGCMAVYRGPTVAQVDLSRILYVGESETQEVALPAYLSHTAGSTYCYLIRRFNGCGHQEKTIAAAVLVRITSNGSLAQVQPNAVIGLRSEQIDTTDVRLVWFYCPLDQKAMPAYFSLYRSNAAGEIDFENVVENTPYKGRKLYCWRIAELTESQHALAIRAVSKNGVDDMSLAQMVCQIAISSPGPAAILTAKPI